MFFRTFAVVRRKTLIFLSLFVIIFVMAEVPRLRYILQEPRLDAIDSLEVVKDSVDSIAQKSLLPDTAKMDSLQKAVWLRNKPLTTLWLPTR